MLLNGQNIFLLEGVRTKLKNRGVISILPLGGWRIKPPL